MYYQRLTVEHAGDPTIQLRHMACKVGDLKIWPFFFLVTEDSGKGRPLKPRFQGSIGTHYHRLADEHVDDPAIQLRHIACKVRIGDIVFLQRVKVRPFSHNLTTCSARTTTALRTSTRMTLRSSYDTWPARYGDGYQFLVQHLLFSFFFLFVFPSPLRCRARRRPGEAATTHGLQRAETATILCATIPLCALPLPFTTVSQKSTGPTRTTYGMRVTEMTTFLCSTALSLSSPVSFTASRTSARAGRINQLRHMVCKVQEFFFLLTNPTRPSTVFFFPQAYFTASIGFQKRLLDFVQVGESSTAGVEEVTFLYQLAAGACPKSYGTNVAKLAGMPDAVLARAAVKSAEVESTSDDLTAGSAKRKVGDGDEREPPLDELERELLDRVTVALKGGRLPAASREIIEAWQEAKKASVESPLLLKRRRVEEDAFSGPEGVV